MNKKEENDLSCYAINRLFNQNLWNKKLASGYKIFEFKTPNGTVLFTTIAKNKNGALCNYRYFRMRMKKLFPKKRIVLGKLSQRKRDNTD